MLQGFTRLNKQIRSRILKYMFIMILRITEEGMYLTLKVDLYIIVNFFNNALQNHGFYFLLPLTLCFTINWHSH